jgi:hypothetical protein
MLFERQGWAKSTSKSVAKAYLDDTNNSKSLYLYAILCAMLDDIEKGFCLFAMQISSNMAKISLSFEFHGSGCTSPTPNKLNTVPEHRRVHSISYRS